MTAAPTPRPVSTSTAPYSTSNITQGGVCWHCGTPGNQPGIVIIDEINQAAPCPMCEVGELHAYKWASDDHGEFWSTPGWDARHLSWNGGKTLQHRFRNGRWHQ